MTSRKVDPVHFFDDRGHSVLSYAELLRERNKLKAANDRLIALVKSQAAKHAAMKPAESPVISLH